MTDQALEALAAALGLDSAARLQGEPVPAAGRPLCVLAAGPLTHEDHATVARFAEFLRNVGRCRQ